MSNQTNPPVAEQEQDRNQLRQIRIEKLQQRQAEGNDPFAITKFDVTAKAASIKASYEETEAKFRVEAGDDDEAFQAKLDTLKEQSISIAGRIMSWRDMGRANFIDVHDDTDRIQVYVRSNDVGKDFFKMTSKSGISAILWESRALSSAQKKVRSPSTRRRSPCSQSRYCRCRKSGMD